MHLKAALRIHFNVSGIDQIEMRGGARIQVRSKQVPDPTGSTSGDVGHTVRKVKVRRERSWLVRRLETGEKQ